jgi:hypothetical protein
MKKRRINSDKIPKEFQLSSYEVCKSWGINEWANAVINRCHIRRNWHLACLDGKDLQVPSHLLESARIKALKMLEKPLDVQSNVLPMNNACSPFTDQSIADLFSGYHVFIDPRYKKWAELYTVARYDDVEFDRHGDKIFDVNFVINIKSDIEKVHNTAAWKMHREVSSFDEKFFVSVDLGASDDFLLKEFKIWLKKTRNDAKIETIRRQFNAADFTRWREQQLLPYLDLTFWAETQGAYFSNATLGNALFPDEIDLAVDEVIRKTVAPNALSVVSDEYESALIWQMRLLNDIDL